MLPAILLARKNDFVVSAPVDHTTARIVRHVGEGILQFPAAVPNLFGIQRRDISHPDCPGMRAIGFDEIAFRRVTRNCRFADERQLLAIGRPLGTRIGVHTSRDEPNCLATYIVDADEAVIAPSRNERKFAAVRRPMMFSVGATSDKLYRLF